MGCSPPGSSVHGILQARILEWVAISLSRGSFWPRDQIQVWSAGRGSKVQRILGHSGCLFSRRLGTSYLSIQIWEGNQPESINPNNARGLEAYTLTHHLIYLFNSALFYFWEWTFIHFFSCWVWVAFQGHFVSTVIHLPVVFLKIYIFFIYLLI